MTISTVGHRTYVYLCIRRVSNKLTIRLFFMLYAIKERVYNEQLCIARQNKPDYRFGLLIADNPGRHKGDDRWLSVKQDMPFEGLMLTFIDCLKMLLKIIFQHDRIQEQC